MRYNILEGKQQPKLRLGANLVQQSAWRAVAFACHIGYLPISVAVIEASDVRGHGRCALPDEAMMGQRFG